MEQKSIAQNDSLDPMVDFLTAMVLDGTNNAIIETVCMDEHDVKDEVQAQRIASYAAQTKVKRSC